MPTENTGPLLKVKQGATSRKIFGLTLPSGIQDFSNLSAAVFRIKRNKNDTNALLSLSYADGDIAVESSKLVVTLSAADTLTLSPEETYWYDLEVTLSTGNYPKPPFIPGRLVVIGDLA